jgi:hypothetical protein
MDFAISPKRARAAAIGAALAAFALVAAPGAQAAPGPGWLPPLDIHSDATVRANDMVVTPDGTTVVAQIRTLEGGQHQRSEVVVRPPGGSFGPPAALTTSQYGGFVRLARDLQGNVAATWSEFVDGKSVVRVATKPAGQPFGPVRDISDPVSDAQYPQVGIGGGTVAVTWVQERRVRAAVGRVEGGFALQPGFSTPPPSVSSATPRVAVAETGAAVIAWEEYHGTNDARIHVAARPANGTFKALPDLRKASRLSDVMVAMSPAGHAAVAWTRQSSAEQSPYIVEAASRGTIGDFAPVDRVSDPATERYEMPHLALKVSADNTAYAVWHGEDGWYASIRPAGGAFGAAGRIPGSSAGDTTFGRALVATAPDSSAIAVWTANIAGAPRGIQSARLQPDGTVGATQVLAATAPPAGFHGHHDDPAGLGIDDQGNAATIWRYSEYPAGNANATTIRTQLERFDAAPPAFEAVEVPATAISGQPVTMRAAATDRWSATKLGWDFGDDSAAVGATQTHVYAAPGVYQVEVVAVDEAINSRAEYRTIEVRGRRPNG